jgi:RNA polymerase sigma factor (TIGR02999 family)
LSAVETLPAGEVTRLLRRSAEGDAAARDAVWSLAHAQLRELARSRLARESSQPTWQPTELVHEAYLKLCDLRMSLADRAHFLALAANTMRRILIDHARGKQRAKRGGDVFAVTLDAQLADDGNVIGIDLLDLDAALEQLAALDARKARAIECSYFGGMSDTELAAALGVSEATAKRDLRSARAWLATMLVDQP